jgi:hypothetical protein
MLWAAILVAAGLVALGATFLLKRRSVGKLDELEEGAAMTNDSPTTRVVAALEIAIYCAWIATIPFVLLHWRDVDGVGRFMFVAWWVAAPLVMWSRWQARRERQ